MKINMGNLDRGIRIAIAAVLVAIYAAGMVSGVLAYMLLGFAAIMVLTSLVKFCPLYTLFGLNTCPMPKK